MKTLNTYALAGTFLLIGIAGASAQTPILFCNFEEASGNYASTGKETAALVPSGPADAHGAAGSGIAGSRAWNSDYPGAKQGMGKARLVVERPVPALEAPESLSIAFWYKTTVELIGNTRFLHKTTDNKRGYSIQAQNGDTIQLSLCDGTKATVLVARSAFYGLKNTWVFFAVTLDARTGEVKFYGGSEKSALKLASTQKFRGEIAASPAKLTIGNISVAADRGFVGQMDNFAFYDTALSQKQLEAFMAASSKK